MLSLCRCRCRIGRSRCCCCWPTLTAHARPPAGPSTIRAVAAVFAGDQLLPCCAPGARPRTGRPAGRHSAHHARHATTKGPHRPAVWLARSLSVFARSVCNRPLANRLIFYHHFSTGSGPTHTTAIRVSKQTSSAGGDSPLAATMGWRASSLVTIDSYQARAAHRRHDELWARGAMRDAAASGWRKALETKATHINKLMRIS